MKRRIYQLTTVTLLAIGAVAAHAQGFRVGLVNIDKIMRESVAAKGAQAKLEHEFSAREREINRMGEVLKEAAERYDRDALTLAEPQRVNRQRQLADQDREFQRKRREFQEDLNARKNEELQLVIEHANRVVKQIAEAESYDLILQEAVYASPKHDITDKVINALNALPRK